MNIEQARYNMVEQQIRPWEVLDQDVLDLLFRIRREDFVPANHRALAFADVEIPLPGGHGAAMWSPKLEARVLQDLTIKPGETVLEIGTGSGYFTALLCARGADVDSVEIDDDLAAEARRKLAAHGMTSLRVDVGDGARGFGSRHYDVIVLTGSTPIVPESLFRQLNPAGRLFAIVGDAPAMTAQLTRFTAPGARVTTGLFETVVAPLVGADTPSRFDF